MLADSLALALLLRHPAYDCFYLALAQREGVQMMTANRRFHARCRAGDVPGLGKRVRLLDGG